MNILFISDILFTGDFARRLAQEGNAVKVYIADEKNKHNLDNLIEKTEDWKNELSWVGKDGLIIFEDAGMGKAQDRLRAEGYTVFGGSELGERTETNRAFGQEIFRQQGLTTLPIFNFQSSVDAIVHIQKHPKAWVIKYSNGHMAKHLCHVGVDLEGKDIIALLENTTLNNLQKGETISLQERVFGVEVGIARYFNGSDWVGPIEYNLEHTHLFPGGIGPNVDEMGTLAWYDDDEQEVLFQKVLAPMKTFLQKANFRGDYAINCIINGGGIFPLEATARLGSPIIHLQQEIHESPWSDFLYAIARGKGYPLKWRKGFGIVVAGVTTPFPYPHSSEGNIMLGLPVFISRNTTEDDWKSIHLDEVASKDGTLNSLFISGTSGNIVYTTGFGDTIDEARAKAYEKISRVSVPKMFYRHDIGADFIHKQLPELQTWGYLKSHA